jgi:histidyl-tRNA synthetase
VIKRIKGTNDIIEDSHVWEWVEERLIDVSKRFNFSEIRTPIFEATELFKRGVGTDTDIVQKEMYTFEDKGGRSITLRPEGTAPVMRAFVEHSLDSKGLPQKLFYIGPMFRYEKPQAGRLRQFHQYGAELIGSPRPEADVTIMTLAVETLKALGLKSFKLKINSTGCEKCRPKYKEALKAYYKPLLPKLCNDCQTRYDRNILRLLDCKRDAQYAKDAPIILDYLCDECKTHFNKVKELLDTIGIEYEVDPTIVRGLDYYTRTVFEITSTSLGAQDAIAGGGRYDHLIEELGGRPTPSVGFATGMERVMIALEKEKKLPRKESPHVYVIAVDEAQRAHALKIAMDLSKEFLVETDVMGRKMKAQFKNASKIGSHHVLVVGEEEVESELYTFKNMKDGSQVKLPLSEIKKILRKEECNSDLQWH